MSERLPHPAPARVLLALAGLLVASGSARAQTNEEFIRELETQAVVSWHAPALASDPVFIRVLGINDFHGELLTRPSELDGKTRALGGAAVLAAYIAAASADPKHTLLLFAGDSIGASPPVSGLLRDEPTMGFLNELTKDQGDCPRLTPRWGATPGPVPTRCHVLATLGNHEFDRGTPELERLLYGGSHPDGPVLGHDWQGTKLPYLAANVARREGHAPLLPGSAIIDLDGAKIGVIGIVTAETPGLVVAGRVAELEFLPEAAAINAEVVKLKSAGVKTILLVIHEGLQAPVTPQWVSPLVLDEVQGRLVDILRGLDGGIDVVIAGHTHKLNNVLVPLKDGKLTLVTQALSGGSGMSLIDLTVDRATGTVIAKSASISLVFGDRGVGAQPVKRIAKLIALAGKAIAPIVARPIGVAAATLSRAETPSGESPLGDFVAEADRAAAGSDFAFVNAGGVRSDIEAGPITFGTLYSVRPFGNKIVRVTLTGAQVLALLEQQWSGSHEAVPRYLRPAGLRYVYDLRRAPGRRVIGAWDADNRPLDPVHRYTVAVNDFLLGGGDFYPVLGEATEPSEIMTDIAALEAYIHRASAPVHASADGRMERVDLPTS